MDNSSTGSAQHSKCYKNRGKEIDDLRRRRQEISVELRKNKREEALLKKRNIDTLQNEQDCTNVNENKFSTDDIQTLVMAALNPDPETKLLAIKSTRMILSTDKNPPIDYIIAAGVLPALIDALRYDENYLLQFEAAWALTNIASGNSNQTRKVVDDGAVDLLIRLLESPNESVAEQSLWALGNIIGDGANLRDFVIERGIIQPLSNILKREPSQSFLRNLSWVLVNMCRSKDPPLSFLALNSILPLLNDLLEKTKVEDLEIIVDVTWAVSYVTDQGNDSIQCVINSGIVSLIVPLLKHDELKIRTPALRVIGNIVTGTDDQTQYVLDLNVLDYIPDLLTFNEDKIVKETLWFLSNVSAGRVEQVQMVIEKELTPLIVKQFSSSEFQLRKEAAWAITNMIMNGTKSQVEYLVGQDVTLKLCTLLSVKDPQILIIVLEALERILKHYSPQYFIITDQIELSGCLDILEGLQNHENEHIYKLAYELVDKYFNNADDSQQGFAFDLNNQSQQQAFEF